MKRTCLLLVAALTAATLPGCSLALMRGPTEAGAPTCRTTRIPAAVDGYFAVGSIAALAATSGRDNDTNGAVVAAMGLSAIPFAVSALYGLSKADACRRATSARPVEHRGPPGAAPGPGPAPRGGA